MNGKTAKKLRKAARLQTIGLPEIKYTHINGIRRLNGCTRELYKIGKKKFKAYCRRGLHK